MAPNGGNLEFSIQNNGILNGMDDHLTHILHQLGSKSDLDIQGSLCDLPMQELHDAREYLFRASVDLVKNKIVEYGLPIGNIKIFLRKRIIVKTYAEDIMKLVHYVMDHSKAFPREVLNMNGQYVDLDTSASSDTVTEDMENGQFKKLVECISDLTNKYDSLYRDHSKLRQQCVNFEAAHANEIQQIRDCMKSNQNKVNVSATLEPHNIGLSTSSQTDTQTDSQTNPSSIPGSTSITPGQQQTNNGSTHGSNSGQIPGEGSTGSTGSNLGSMGGPGGSAPDSVFSDSRQFADVLNDALPSPKSSPDPDGINQSTQSHQKPVFLKRDNKKRLIDSSTSPGLVKISNVEPPSIIRAKGQYKNTDSGDLSDSDYTDCPDDAEGFSVVERKHRRRRQTDGLITGIKRETGVKVYVQNIHRKRGQSYKEIAYNVKKYCMSEGVRVMNAYVIGNKVTDDMVGCQLTIPMRHFDTVIADRFWPSEVICKRWESKTYEPSSDDNASTNNRSRSRNREQYSRGRKASTSSFRSSSGRGNRYPDHWDYDNETGTPGTRRNPRRERRNSNMRSNSRSLSRNSRK